MRLTPLPADQWDDEVRGAFKGMLPRDRQNPEGAGTALSTLVRHPDLTKAFLGFNVYLLFRSSLPARLREVAILRVAHRRHCAYEWEHHVGMAKAEGLTDADVEAVHRGAATNEVDGLVLRAVDELDEKSNLTDETWAALGETAQRPAADGLRLHRWRLRHVGHGVQHFWCTARKGKVRKLPHFPKPAAGSWTESYPDLGTAPVNYSDSIDPAHYAKEQEAIFKHSWLNVGRVERLPKNSSYFTKEIAVAKASIIVVKGKDGVVRAFHNICRHRGNKLVWNDFPNEEVSGTCRQFTCKYHAWRFSTEGELTFVQQEEEFFDLDKSKFGLKGVRCEIWEGFIFINLDESAEPLADSMGLMGKGLEGYPFQEMTEVYSYKAEINSNWKLFIDAFAEFYHAPVLHVNQATRDEAEKLQSYGFEALHYQLQGQHSMVSSWGGMAPPKDISMVKPIERKLHSGLFGPWDRPDIEGLDSLPPGVNPGGAKQWGVDSFIFFPNFMLLIWAPGWYLTYHYWPTSVSSHLFEASLYFVPPKTARERLGQELAAVTFKEYALQDANTLEATQTMISSGYVTEFPLNDQEILLRHLHKTARDKIKEHENA